MKYSTERWSTNLINVKNKKQKQKQKQKTSKQTKLKKNNRKKQRKQNIEKKEEEEKPFMNSNHLTQKKHDICRCTSRSWQRTGMYFAG